MEQEKEKSGERDQELREAVPQRSREMREMLRQLEQQAWQYCQAMQENRPPVN